VFRGVHAYTREHLNTYLIFHLNIYKTKELQVFMRGVHRCSSVHRSKCVGMNTKSTMPATSVSRLLKYKYEHPMMGKGTVNYGVD